MLPNIISDFLMIFISLLVESLPFVVIGVGISALIGRFVNASQVLKYKSSNRIVSHIQTAIIGVFLPVCECGNVPLAKRLSMMGFRPSEVITFMLAAPILNPLVLVSTLEAFNLDKNIGIMRVLLGGLIAIVIGLLFSTIPNQESLMVSRGFRINAFQGFSSALSADSVVPDAPHSQFLLTFVDEFFNVFKMLILGCIIASAFQIVVPRELIAGFGANPVWSVLAMIGLAFLISICSSVDAFFALSLASTFSLGSIMAFLVFGPMIDIKTLTMLRSVFKPGALIMITILVTLLSVLVGLGVNYFYKIQY
jgi:uncharacterized protein